MAFSSSEGSNAANQLFGTVAALVDAFDPGASGAKYPDGNGHATMVAQLRTRVSVGSDANGYAGIQLQWTAPNLYRTYASIAGDVITWSANSASGGYTSLNANGTLYRVTTAGVAWRSTRPSTADQGLAYVCDRFYASDTGATSYAAVIAAADYEFTVKEPYTVPCHLLGAGPRVFRLMASTDLTTAASTVIFISGLPVSTAAIGEFDIIMNVEYVPMLTSVGSVLTQYATVGPSNSAIADRARDAVGKLIPVNTSVWKQMVNLAIRGGKAAVKYARSPQGQAMVLGAINASSYSYPLGVPARMLLAGAGMRMIENGNSSQ